MEKSRLKTLIRKTFLMMPFAALTYTAGGEKNFT